jgi:hypothetical protein
VTPAHPSAEVNRIFNEHYLANLNLQVKGSPPFLRLESENFVNQLAYTNCCPAGMHKHDQRCTELMGKTVNELSDCLVALMLSAIHCRRIFWS